MNARPSPRWRPNRPAPPAHESGDELADRARLARERLAREAEYLEQTVRRLFRVPDIADDDEEDADAPADRRP